MLLLPVFPRDCSQQDLHYVHQWCTIEFKCRICFLKRGTRVEMHQHGFSCHLPQEHVDFRYSFSPSELEVIASRDEDRYNREESPRTLPLQDGICILRELLPSDPNGATGLSWYAPSTDTTYRDRRVPLPGPPQTRRQDVQDQPGAGLSAL